MARPQIPTINWRNELRRLDTFLSKDGGVIHIRTNTDSPSSAFAKALRSRMEHGSWGIPWQTIQFDGNNAATHYFRDMVQQIERSLGIVPCVDTGTSPAVTIASNITAGGNVVIRDIHVDNAPTTAQLHSECELIASHISGGAKEKRVCLLFFDSDNADPKELSAFRSVLWDERLESLVTDGLLLVVFIGHTSGSPRWLPDPDLIVELPERYDHQSALNAIEDLAKYTFSEGIYPSEESAKVFAETMVANNMRPKELYANFAAVQLQMEQWK